MIQVLQKCSRCGLRTDSPIVSKVTCEDDRGRHYDEHDWQSLKDVAGKLPWDLFPWEAAREVVRVLAYGAGKYARGSWRQVSGWRDKYDAALERHLVAWRLGEEVDPETGLHHLAHASCDALFLLGLTLLGDSAPPPHEDETGVSSSFSKKR